MLLQGAHLAILALPQHYAPEITAVSRLNPLSERKCFILVASLFALAVLSPPPPRPPRDVRARLMFQRMVFLKSENMAQDSTLPSQAVTCQDNCQGPSSLLSISGRSMAD